MKNLCMFILMLFLASTVQAKKSESLKLLRAGVKVQVNKKSWKKMNFPSAMSAPDLMLINNNNPQRTRTVLTTFAERGVLCGQELKKLKKLKQKYQLLTHKKFACLINIKSKGEEKYIAIKEIFRKKSRKHNLSSQVILVETKPISLKLFRSWISSVRNI